jgi:hypothetical protein
MNRTALRCEALESRDALSSTLMVAGATDPVDAPYQGTHVLYQDVVIPTDQSNQGWGKWEVNLAR